MKTNLTKIIAICCGIALSGSVVVSQEKFTPAQLNTDLSFAKQALKEAHPGLYRYNTEEQIDSLFRSTATRLNHEMTQQEFYQLLLPVITQIKCGHTKLHPESNWTDNYFYGTDKLFPVKLFFEGDHAYILGSYIANIVVEEGLEVVSINNKPIKEIIDKLLTGFFSDGSNKTFKYIEMSKFFSAYYANLIEAPDSFTIAYRIANDLKTLKVPAISRAQINNYEKQQASQESVKEPYSLEFIRENVALLTISSFWMESKGTGYGRFLKRAFEEINDKDVQHLILDVRDNEGGKDRRGAQLLSCIMNTKFRYYDRLEASTKKKYSFAKQAYLPGYYGILRRLISKTDSGTYIWKHNKNLKIQKPKKNSYAKEVYVLTNGASFSVTAEFAAVTHYLKRATIIGEETGGGYYGNNSGAFVIVPLPNSRLVIGMPMLAYYLAVKDYPLTDRGIIPDYEVKPTIYDVLEGKDPVLDFTLKLIR